MELFNVYSLYPIEPVRGKGCYVYDAAGTEYLDLYGGHAVISIGHAQPDYVRAVQEQVARLGFYSNSVENSLQVKLAERLGRISGYDDYRLFLCNSGAEANENALKLASFHTGRSKALAISKAFHGRTSGAVAVTDNPGDLVALQPHAERGVRPPERHRGDAREARHAGVRGGDRRGHSGRCGHPLPDGRVPARRARRGDRDRDAAGARRNPVGIRPHGPLLRPPWPPASAPT